MAALIFWEIKKNYLQKTIVIGILLAVLLDGIYLYYGYYQMDNQKEIVTAANVSDSCYQYYTDLHNKYDGAITKDKVCEIAEENTRLNAAIEDGTYNRSFDENTITGYIFGDYYYMKQYIYSPIKYTASYAENMQNTLAQIEDNIDFYEKAGNRYEVSKHKYLREAYQNRRIEAFYETASWNYLFAYDFSDLLMILLILLGITPVFLSEKTDGMDILILTSVKGKYDLYIAKFISIISYTLFLTMLFAILNYVFVAMIYGLPGGNRPLYCIELYQNSAYNGSLTDFYLCINLMKGLGALSAGILAGMLAQKANSFVSSFLGSVLMMVVLLYISGYITAAGTIYRMIALLSPFSLFKGGFVFQSPTGISVAGSFLPADIAAIYLQVILISIWILINVRRTVRKRLH